MPKISKIKARKIIDSRGNPTVEVDVYGSGGSFGRAAAPSGASKGTFEVKDYPKDGIDKGIARFNGDVAAKISGLDLLDQKGFDAKLHEVDNSNDFANLGGNIAIAASLAFAKACAMSNNVELYRHLIGDNGKISMPSPLGNVIGGGKHAINGTIMQEFLAVSSSKSYIDAVMGNIAVHKRIGTLLKSKFPDLPLGLGDEKAWVAQLNDLQALEMLNEAILYCSNTAGVEIRPAVDLAASEFCDNGTYNYKDRSLSTDEQIDFVADLAEKFNIKILEDPLDEEDFEGFAKLTKRIGQKTLIVGDDLFVTNAKRLEKGIKMGAANAILIKPNQIGTLTDMMETVAMANKNGYESVISHRSGETEDSTIAHLAVGLGIRYIKTGTIGGERTAKHNELVRIEENISAV